MSQKNISDMELGNISCTRFRVQMVDSNETSNSGNREEDIEKQDNSYLKSLKYFTREALPRLDNYRHIMSIQAAYRPTLEDLHEPVSSEGQNIQFGNESRNNERYNKNRVESGWIEGVLIPNLLNMLGPVFFLRFVWIVAEAGLVESILIVLLAGIISLITSLSVSAISSNGFVKGGGGYVMMSRSFGPEFGIPIGLTLLMGNIGLCAMYTLGLVEYVLYHTGLCLFDCSSNDIRYYSLMVYALAVIIVVFVTFACRSFGNILTKVRDLLFALIVAVILYYVLSSFITKPSKTDGYIQVAQFSVARVGENLDSKYHSFFNIIHHSVFFFLFSLLYPALAEFMSGVNASENLNDPLKAIPRGTVLSILIGIVMYIGAAVVMSGNVIHLRNTEEADNITVKCLTHGCEKERFKYYFLLESSVTEKRIIFVGTILISVYSLLLNCFTTLTSFKILSTDKLYPQIFWLNSHCTKQIQIYGLTTFLVFSFLLIGVMNSVASIVSVIILAGYALINFSMFHMSLIQPIGWRPTFKRHNMWISLCGSILCLCIMFLINWITALITVILVLASYLTINYQKPDVNWGSSTQAQTYNSALLSVYALNSVSDHVKNYRPQVLVLSGLPSHRPPLVTFARLITKHVSLLICGHIHSNAVSQSEQTEYATKARKWLKFHRIKAFYTQVDESTFEDGARSLMQATGLGKLRPNIVLMGYKSNWTTSSKTDLDMYFNTIHKALDSHLAVCILRVKTGLDFSSLKVDDKQLNMLSDVQYNFSEANQQLSKENRTKEKEDCKNNPSKPEQPLTKLKNGNVYMSSMKDSYEDIASTELYRFKNGTELSKEMEDRITLFQKKQKPGTIDVWWLYDDGGLTLLLPYIISIRRSWSCCKLRIFALSNNKDTLEFEERNVASLLSKFRIDYSDLTIFSGLMKKPQEETVKFYDNLIQEFVTESSDSSCFERPRITKSDLSTMQDKTNRHLRLRELLLEHSQDANLIVMTLPIPRKSVIPAALYMSWLETLTQDMPPFLLVRGNQTSVLTFYS